MFRRHLGRLLDHLSSLTELGMLTKIDWDERIARKEHIMERLVKEANFIHDVLVPKWYLAFSALVADNQYAPLGLFLMATLSAVKKEISGLRPREQEEVSNSDAAAEENLRAKGGSAEDLSIDLGEKVSREDVLAEVVHEDFGRSEGSMSGAGTSQKRRRSKSITPDQGAATSTILDKPGLTKEKKKKKKKKKGDAFDDLFSSLL